MPVTPPPPRLSDEPAEWYERFKAWLDLPQPRSLLELYNRERESKGKSQKKSVSHPGSWRDKPALYQWEKRASEWDAKESARRAQERAEEIDEWIREEVAIAKKMREKGKLALDIPLVRGEVRETTKDGNIKVTKLPGDPVAVKAAVYMIAEGIRIGRAALNIPPPAPPYSGQALADLIPMLPKPFLDRVARGEPLDVVFRDWALSMAQQQKQVPATLKD